MVTRTEFYLSGFTLNFLCPAQFFAELAYPNERNQLRPSTLCTTVWIILQTSPFNCDASYCPFINLNVSLMLACLGTPDLITVLFFSVSWQTICYENENAIFSLSPINLLLIGTN